MTSADSISRFPDPPAVHEIQLDDLVGKSATIHLGEVELAHGVIITDLSVCVTGEHVDMGGSFLWSFAPYIEMREFTSSPVPGLVNVVRAYIEQTITTAIAIDALREEVAKCI